MPKSHQPGDACRGSEHCKQLEAPTQSLSRRAVPGARVPSWHGASPHCFLKAFSGSFPPGQNVDNLAELMFSLTSLWCLQRAAASQGSLPLRHFAPQSSQRATEQQGYSSSSAPVLLPCKAERQLLGSQVLVQPGTLGYWHPRWGKAVKRLSQHHGLNQMHHVCHPQLPNSMKSSDVPSKSPFLMQNTGVGQGTSYLFHPLCSVTQTWEHKPSWHHRHLFVGSHTGLFHIPKGASTSGDHTLIFQVSYCDGL